MASMSYRVGDDTSRRVIDVATGILIGLRGCSEAFAVWGELFDRARPVSLVN
jgi:hypothetical protein